MKGYLERPEENAQCLMEDGFIRTGDLGFYNDRGDFQLVDRIKEIIKYNDFFSIESIFLTIRI